MTFKAKLAVGIVTLLSIIFIVLFSIVFSIQRNSYNTLVGAIESRCQSNANSLAIALESDLAAGSFEEVQGKVGDFVSAKSTEGAVMVFDVAHALIASTNQSYQAKRQFEELGRFEKSQSRVNAEKNLVTAGAVVTGEKGVVGYVLYSESLSGVKADQTTMLLAILGGFLGALLAAAIGVTILGGRAAAPINSLLAAVGQIEKGDLVSGERMVRDFQHGSELARSGVHKFQETSALTKSFGSMSATLRQIVGQLSEAATHVGGAVATIDSSSTELFEGVQVQSDAAGSVFEAVEAGNQSFLAIDSSIGQLNSSADRATNSMASLSDSLKSTTQQVTDLGDSVKKTDGEVKGIAKSASQIASSITILNEAVTNTATAVAQFNRSTQSIESNTLGALKSAEEARDQATKGQQDVLSTIDGMQRINTTFQQLESAYKKLNDQIDLISNFVQAIEAVAARTKLLAVNTNILAAGAGEHGKAFAVVAGEMKELFDSASNSTREITEIISLLNEEREKTAEAMQLGMESVNVGQDLAVRAGRSMEAIRGLNEQSHTKMSQSAVMTREQLVGSDSIAQATEQIATMGTGISISTMEQRKASEMVHNLVSEMVATISGIQQTIEGEVVASETMMALINTIYRQVEALSTASLDLKGTNQHIVRKAGSIRDVASTSLSQAQAVTESVGTLSELVQSLHQNVRQFKVN